MLILISLYSTCFWGGDIFAPKLKVKSSDGQYVSIQTFLQSAFMRMWEVVVKSVGDLDGVLGFEVRTAISLLHSTIMKIDHERAP